MNVLEGKVAVISGGTSGIGARTAELFVAEGAAVVIGGRRELEGKELASRLGSSVRFVRADVSVETDVESLIGRTVEEFGRIDILVNNAGVGGQPPGGWSAIDIDRFWAVLAVHVGGVVAGIKHAAPVMTAAGIGEHHQHGQRRRACRWVDGSGLLDCQGSSDPPDTLRGDRARATRGTGQQCLTRSDTNRDFREGGRHGPGRGGPHSSATRSGVRRSAS